MYYIYNTYLYINRNRLTDIENTPKGKGLGGRDKLGVWD